MGMYDYVGHSGDQVKCFDVPCLTVNKYNKETKKAEPYFHVVGGRLKNMNTAPYMTPYYNYGPDFAILDYRWYEHEPPMAHIFKNGEWVETVECADMADTYDYPPVTIGYYGDRINISSAAEMHAFVAEFIAMDKRQEEILADKYAAANITEKFITRDRALDMGHEALMAEIAIRNEIETYAFNSTFGPFNEKWFDRSHESELEIIGLVLYDYLDEQRDVREGYRDTTRVEYEWYALFGGAIECLKEKFANPVEDYLQWCDREGIEVDKQMVRGLFAKYTQPAPQDVIDEYEKYWDELPDWWKK
jgi:hypothetical protein